MKEWLAMGAAAVGGAALAEWAGAKYLFHRTMVRSCLGISNTQKEEEKDWEKYLPLIRERRVWLESQNIEKVSIQSFDGLRLSGTVFPAEEPSKRTVLCLHGYTTSGITQYAVLAPFYHSLGYNMVMVDARAHGESEGEYIGFGCMERYDCRDWAEWAYKRFGGSVILHGISMGAATALMASSFKMPYVKGIIADCGFTCAWDIFAAILRKDYHMPPFPVLTLAERMAKKEAGFGFRDCTAPEEVSRTEIPILFIHGDEDNFVPSWMGRRNFEACTSEKYFLLVSEAGHAESYHKDPERYESCVRDFLKKYVSENICL